MATPESLGDDEASPRPRTKGFVTKRAHKKSRAGCRGCKQRKIKCDESRPQCTYCKMHRLQCFYGGDIERSSTSSPSDDSLMKWSSRSSPSAFETASRLSSSPASSVSSLPNWDSNDLRLLHHYATLTSGSLALINRRGVERVVKFEIPRLAFEHEFMMHSVLGLASLHLHRLAPEVPEHLSLTIAHRVKALSGLQAAISQFSRESYRAIVAGSLVLVILSSDLSTVDTGSELWIGNWLGLWAGMREMIRLVSWEFLEQSGLAPIFARDNTPRGALAHLPFALTGMLQSMDPENDDTRTILTTLSCLSKLYHYLLLNGLTDELTTRVTVWPANTDVAEFSVLAKRKHPQALIIAAYYLVFTKVVDEIWWITSISGDEIENIMNALPVEFRLHMRIPLLAVHLSSKWDIASLLLSELPGGALYEGDLSHASEPIYGRARELLSEEDIAMMGTSC